MRSSVSLHCSKCHFKFQVLEDEQFDHWCPRCGFGREREQQEHFGIDYYSAEILEGDEIAIDKDNFEEIILKVNLKQYVIERCHFLYKAGIFVDVERSEIVMEADLEKYLHEEHGFYFATAE
jgi:hypothetical protein